jgi:uncharacterized protein (TIGR03545 family)
MKWMRWRGLIPFVVITALIAVFWFLLVDGYIERLIEKAGTAAVGAKVELDSADLSLFPAGLTLMRLQVTNPDEPMRNAVEVKRIAFTMDAAQLLMRKAIINEMSVEEVRLDTPRKTSGAIKEAEKAKPVEAIKAKLEIPSFKLPDVKELLEKEELETLRLASTLREDIEKEKEAWKGRLEELPGKEKIEGYKKRIEELKSAGKGITGALGAAAGVQELKKDIESDINQIKDAQKTYKEEFNSIKQRVSDAAKAPERDLKRLKDKYSISPEGFSNATQALLGGKVAAYIRKADLWYARLKPLMERARERGEGPETVKPVRAKGLDVHFREHNPLPEFLIKLINASVSLKAGDISGKVKNVTNEQHVIGVPLSFDFSGEKLKDMQSVSLDGSIDRVRPKKPRDSANLEVMGYRVSGAVLSDSEDLPVNMKEGEVDLALSAALSGRALDAKATGALKTLSLSAGREGETDRLMQSIASIIEGISELKLAVKVTGTLDDYDMDISSDLDRVLKGALSKEVERQAAIWSGELKSAIKEKTGVELEGLNQGLGGLGSIDKELQGRLGDMDGLLAELAKGAAPGGIKLPF